jgi:uncharacterized protein (DUF2249 family)
MNESLNLPDRAVREASPRITLDLRALIPRDRHILAIATFAKLPEGEALELVNDHDPKPLLRQMQEQFPSLCRYVESGPDTWRVVIARTAGQAAPRDGACCGACSCA